MEYYEYETISNPTPLIKKVLDHYGFNGWMLVNFTFESRNIRYPEHGEFHYVFMRVIQKYEHG